MAVVTYKMTTQVDIVADNRSDFIDRVRRCASFLNVNVAPLSPFCAFNGFAGTEGGGGFELWGTGQTWMIKETGRNEAIAFVDDEVAATMVALLT